MNKQFHNAQQKISNLLYQINDISIELSDRKNNEYNESELFDNDNGNNNLYCNQNNNDLYDSETSDESSSSESNCK